jgi:hypothetical protein
MGLAELRDASDYSCKCSCCSRIITESYITQAIRETWTYGILPQESVRNSTQ